MIKYVMDNLKQLAIKSCFKTLSTPEKRELALELLEEAEYVNAVEISAVDPCFREWLDKDKHEYDEAEIERIWAMWNFVKDYSISGHYIKIDPLAVVYPYCQDEDMRKEGRGFSEYITETDAHIEVSRNEFFDWVLKNLSPDQLSIELRDVDDKDCDGENSFLLIESRLTMNMLLEMNWHQLSYDKYDTKKTANVIEEYYNAPMVAKIKKQKI